ncbi:MAG: hypothetical protein ACFFG0_35100, partial [Candidatus Thorarchaeota archaeon]
AEDLLLAKEYRKAKKSFLKAAELATLVQEVKITSFLENKGEQVGLFPDLLRERENLQKEIVKIINEFENNKMDLNNLIIGPVDRLIDISNNFEENDKINELKKLKSNVLRVSRLAKELDGLKNKIKENLTNI